jgi:hypothetical protein
MSTLQPILRPTHRWAPTLLLAAAVATGFAPAAVAQECSAKLETAPVRDLENVRLATFKIGNLSEVRILSIPEADELSVMEIIPAGGEERFVLQPGTTPAEVFLRLAPRDAAVPEAIAKSDTRKLLADRRLVASLDEPIQIAPWKLGLKPRFALKSGSGSCQDGIAGATYFAEHHCDTLGGPGYGSSEGHCDEGAEPAIERDSGSTRRTTYTRMASCGDGNNRLRHSKHLASGWTTVVDEIFTPNQVVSWWSSTTGIKHDRRARFEENNSSGWVRGWTKFHSEVAEGW